MGASGPPLDTDTEHLPLAVSEPTGESLTEATADVRTPWREFVRKFRRQHAAILAGAVVLLLVLAAVFAPLIAPFDPENFFDYESLNARPSARYWLGVDPLGRDIFSRLVWGARISLAAGFGSVALGAIVGTILGLLAGYFEGWWDRIIMRICDVLFAFPGILLAIGIVAILGGGMFNVVIAVAVFSVPTFARLVRLPGALPFVFTGLRQASSLAVIAAVVSEYFGGLQDGLGSRITSAAAFTAYPRAWAYVVGACVLGLIFYLATLVAERFAMPWRSRLAS